MKLPSETNEKTADKTVPASRPAAKLPAKRKFTKQVETFVEEMANPLTKSATEAAVKAGSPPKSARVTASRWLTNANILAEIQIRIGRSMAHSQVTREEVLGGAVRQMRSSMDDLLDEHGHFDIEKARANGSIDFIKKLKIKTVTNKETGSTETTCEIEIFSNQDGRREVANYIGLEKMPIQVVQITTDEQMAQAIFTRMVERGHPAEDVRRKISERFPAIDVDAIIKTVQ